MPDEAGRRMRVRRLRRTDEAEWRRLWTGYLDFYGASVPEVVYRTTFERLLSDDPWAPSCFVAVMEPEGEGPSASGGEALAGLVHYLYHAHCWRVERVCYLQDLFADPAARGLGVGRALIEAVYAQADRDGAPAVYWLTQDHNRTARQLYDRIATVTPFIKYQR